MYVDVDRSSCIDLSFNLGTSTTSRSWNILVTHYDCDYNNLAPADCHQYFFGSDSGTFKSLNYGGGVHLANQNMNYCFRQESSKSKICYSYVSAFSDFDISAQGTVMKAQVGRNPAKAGCCGYGDAGKGAFDCIQIPGAIKVDSGSIVTGGAFCGTVGLIATNDKKTDSADANGKSVCSKTTPFVVTFLTDGIELDAEEVAITKGKAGFKLAYILS